MQEVVTPQDVMDKDATSHERLVVHLLVKRRLERVNEALKSEAFTDLEKIMGRTLTLNSLTREEYAEVVRHYRAAGWKVGVMASGYTQWDKELAWMRQHPYLKTLTFVFCLPGSSMVGKKHPPRDPNKVYANPYSEAMYRGGDEKVTREDEFAAALRAGEAVSSEEGIPSKQAVEQIQQVNLVADYVNEVNTDLEVHLSERAGKPVTLDKIANVIILKCGGKEVQVVEQELLAMRYPLTRCIRLLIGDEEEE